MMRVVLIGSGNVAQNLFNALNQQPLVTVIQVLGRTRAHLAFAESYCKITDNYASIEKADISILAVSDSAINEVSKKIPTHQGLVVHTSGATAMHTIENTERIGVFYPLQTFTKGKLISFTNIPICIEASKSEDYHILEKLGKALSNTVVRISSVERQKLHVAAVFANNFTNYCYTLAEEICKEHQLDFDLLKPLITETALKLSHLSPTEAQTGPAKRRDQNTLHTHLTLLKDSQKRELYTLLSNAIKHTHGKKL